LITLRAIAFHISRLDSRRVIDAALADLPHHVVPPRAGAVRGGTHARAANAHVPAPVRSWRLYVIVRQKTPRSSRIMMTVIGTPSSHSNSGIVFLLISKSAIEKPSQRGYTKCAKRPSKFSRAMAAGSPKYNGGYVHEFP